MVSLRRRRILGLWDGRKNTSESPKTNVEAAIVENYDQNAKHMNTHLMPPENFTVEGQEEKELANLEQVNILEAEADESKPGSSEDVAQEYPPLGVKKRKRHKRKQVENREPCVMRGVYFKNMKWQAAIKVDKKQIHLGTVESQEKAARLYDRAAFMCGRQPNFDLPEIEKQELLKLTWKEFLDNTRCAIAKKRNQRRLGPATRGKSEVRLSKDIVNDSDYYDDDMDTDVDILV